MWHIGQDNVILVLVAHPDDEALYAGGLLSHLVSVGQKIHVTSLTKGEAGRTLGLCSQKDLGAFREQEFFASMQKLGIRSADITELPDGLLDCVPNDVVDVVQDRIRAIQPNMVLTYPQDGVNGHRDHLETHKATRSLSGAAFEHEMYVFDPHQKGIASVFGRIPNALPKIEALSTYRSQALSVVDFMGRFPSYLQGESFACAVSKTEPRKIPDDGTSEFRF